MKMEDILKNKGINYISEEYGVRKTMKFESYDGEKSIVGVEIYEDTLEIGVHVLKGSCPDVVQLFKALLSDKHVRRMIVAYQNKGRVKKYKMWYTSGMSGREDYFITFAYDVSGFLVKKTKHLLHISCAGKLNEGFGNRNNRMYIGDFVELLSYIGWDFIGGSRQELRRESGVKYIRPHFIEEMWREEYTTEVSKLI